MIRFYDTKSRKKIDFEPLEPGVVKMYVCGPTVYNYIHIGNARTFISFDIIRRYLMWRGYDVIFVSNITDVDDKIIGRSLEENKSASEIAAEYSKAFIDDMHSVNVLDPTIRPRATEEIGPMIELVQELIDTGHAYEVDGDVYFSVRSFPSYGALSGRNIDEMESGHRALRTCGIENRKRDSLDFALWKAAKPGEPAWDSPWGQGRPGWHLECSSMSRKYLGLPFDIHGGGADLVFPHHENERAQSEAAEGTVFSRYWMHGGMLQINSEKMSKSLGNFKLLRDVIGEVDPEIVRFLMLQTHYRSPLDFSPARLEEAATALGRIVNVLRNIDWAIENAQEKEDALNVEEVHALQKEALDAFTAAMDDDFNTPKALGCVFDFVGAINSLLAGKTLSTHDVDVVKELRATILDVMGNVFGVDLEAVLSSSSTDNDDESSAALIELAAQLASYEGSDYHEAAEAILTARSNARAQKDWGTADAIRDSIAALGLAIEDTPQGSRIVAG